MTATVLLAGCGDLGCEVAGRLVSAGHQITGLRRSDSVLPQGVIPFKADVSKPETLQALDHLQPDILIYCVAADAHTDESYRVHYVDGLRNVLAALADSVSLLHVFFVSSTGIYGQQSDELLDETVEPTPVDFSGIRMLEAEALLKNLPCPATALRLSGIYGPGRNRMINLAKVPQQWPQHNIWTNRIHRDDAASAIAYMIERVNSGKPVEDCYIVTDSTPVSQYKVLQWMAAKLGVEPAGNDIPQVSGGKRLSNQRLLASGFKLAYPDYISGYSSLLSASIE